MKIADIVQLGTSVIKNGVVLWQGITQLTDDPTDVEPLGEGDMMQCLGVSSMPYPATAEGKAEGVCLRGVAGRDTTWIGARDTRSAEIVGKLKKGDTVLHSTGPQQASQVQCKEDKRQVFMSTKDKNGRTMVVLLDGNANKFQVVLNGCIFEINGNTKQALLKCGDESILLGQGSCAIDATCILGGTKPDRVNKLCTSVSANPAGIATAPTPGITVRQAKGVWLGK